jgi:hypothetical protein
VILYQKPGLAGLELWNGLSAEGRTLYQLRDSPHEYFGALSAFLDRLHRGTAETAEWRGTAGISGAKGFRHLVCCGGTALDPRLAAALAARPLPYTFEINSGGAYSGREGAAMIAGEMGWRRWVALDLGQTQLKVMTSTKCFRVSRDPSVLPYGARSLDVDVGRSRVREVILSGLLRAEQLAGRPFDGIVLGLPAAIDSMGEMQPASYPGLQGPVEAVFAGLFPAPAVVLNDAVLAARGFPPKDGAKTLVITLGFGVGGALWA